METPSVPLWQSVLATLGRLTVTVRGALGKAGVKSRMALIKASHHPRVTETCETCSDLWSDLKKLQQHPKVHTWRERMEGSFTELRQQSTHPLAVKIRDSLAPRYLALTVGTSVAVLMGLLATQALKHSQHIRTQEFTREAGMEMRQLRLQQRSQSLDNWRGEQEKLQRALKALEESRSTGALRLSDGDLWS